MKNFLWLAVASVTALLALNGSARANSINEKAYEIGERLLGVEEIPGPANHTMVTRFFQATNGRVYPDSTAWCSAFANFAVHEAGGTGTGSLTAKSWLKWGVPVSKPRRGDIVVFWRGHPSSWMGHVAFFAYETERHVYVLGGNQKSHSGGAVTIAAYPKDRVLAYRRAA